MTPDSRAYRLTVNGLLALSLVLLAYPILRIGFDFEIDNNEGWDAFLQMRAMAGASLYNLDTPYFVNDYPPLSFYIVGAVSKVVGDPVIAGRLVSIAGLLGISFACASIVRSVGGSRQDATLAWATSTALFASFGTDYVGINDPHMLGQALLLACMALYFRIQPGIVSGIALAALTSVSVLTKHNMLVIPLILSVDILLRWPMHAKVAYFASGIIFAALAATMAWAVVGPSFFRSLLGSPIYDPARGFLMTIDILARLQAPVAIVGLALLLWRKERPFGLIGAYLALGLIQGAIFTGGANDDVNHFFEAFSALAIGAGLLVHRIGHTYPAPVARAAIALLVNAGVLFYAPLALGRFVVDIGGDMAERERLFQQDVAFVQSAPGKVLCQSFLLCFRAGQPMFYDPHNMRMAMARGDVPSDLLTGMLDRGEIALMQVEDTREHPLDAYPGKQGMPAFFIHFNDDVFDALDRNYAVARIGLTGRFFVPKTTVKSEM